MGNTLILHIAGSLYHVAGDYVHIADMWKFRCECALMSPGSARSLRLAVSLNVNYGLLCTVTRTLLTN